MDMDIRFFVLVAFLFVTSASEEVSDTLKSNYHLYKEIGCKPVQNSNNQTAHYDCDEFLNRNRAVCHYRGKVFQPQEALTNSIDVCRASCFCLDPQRTNRAQFTCANVECPSIFGYYPKPGCIFRHHIDKCCETEYCPEGKKLHQCVYNGKTYNEGSLFYSDWTVCVCTTEFDGTINEKYCKEQRCAYELSYSNRLMDKCAPVFYEKVDGCPIQWRCYNDTGIPDTIIQSTSQQAKSTDAKCLFGPLQLNVGDKLAPEITYHKGEDCSCNVPPFVTCSLTYN